MDEEQRIQGSTSVDGADPVTASGADVTGSETEFVTENEADHEDSVTSVTSEKPDTKVIRLNVTDIERIMAGGYEDEKPATVVHRLLDEVDELRTGAVTQAEIEREMVALRREIAELEASIEDLRSGAETEIIPGQPTFSIKDAMDSLKGVCDDDAVCIKFASKMVETQAAAMNKRLDREHSTEHKRLDREDKEKDRALKKEMAESKAGHDKDMTMIKKGMVKKEDLEDIVFLGQKNTSPADRIKNKKELAARQAASEEEEFGDMDPPEEDPAYD